MPRKPVESDRGEIFNDWQRHFKGFCKNFEQKRLAIQENLVYDAIPILKAEVWFMCKEKEITVLKVSPHKKPEVVTVKNELSALQEAVSSGVKD